MNIPEGHIVVTTPLNGAEMRIYKGFKENGINKKLETELLKIADDVANMSVEETDKLCAEVEEGLGIKDSIKTSAGKFDSEVHFTKMEVFLDLCYSDAKKTVLLQAEMTLNYNPEEVSSLSNDIDALKNSVFISSSWILNSVEKDELYIFLYGIFMGLTINKKKAFWEIVKNAEGDSPSIVAVKGPEDLLK